MCKPGEPCHEAGEKETNTSRLMGRIEMLIVMAELYEHEKVEAPHAAIAMVDVIGPLMMDTMRRAKGWSHAQMAQAVIKQKARMYESAGMPAPPEHPLEAIINLLSELQTDAKDKAP
jgi:hypothetical protein